MMRVKTLLRLLLLVYFVFEVYSDDPSGNFQCNEDENISGQRFCDGKMDCADGRDEDYGCDRKLCGHGNFSCRNGMCINILNRCDFNQDCTDGSDELKCALDYKIAVQNCQMREDRFLCANKRKCIDIKFACDGHCNCADCSDEGVSGCSKYDDYVCNSCFEACISTDKYVPSEFNASAAKKTGLGTCSYCEFPTCHQKCLSVVESNDRPRKRCFCDEHYYPSNDEKTQTCRNMVPYENVIIYSTTNEVKLFNLTTKKTIVLRSGVDCTALTAAHDDVFYATFVNNVAAIFKTSITTKRSTELIQCDSFVSSIAVDWITNNIYYTTKTAIWVCSNDGRTCSKLDFCSQCRVKVTPKSGLMFLLEEEKYLLQSHLDGSNRQNLSKTFDSFNIGPLLKEVISLTHRIFGPLGTPPSHGSFAVDESRDIVIWSKYKSVFLQSRFHGLAGRLDYIEINGNEKEAFDFDSIDDIFFYTMENENEIYFGNLSTPNVSINYLSYGKVDHSLDDRIIDNGTTAIKYIRVYNRLQQQTKVPNPCAKTSCSLCLLRLRSDFKVEPLGGGLNYTCKCENITTTDDQFSCEDKPPLMSMNKNLPQDFMTADTASSGLNFFSINCLIIAAIAIGMGVYFTLRRLNSREIRDEPLQLNDDL